LPKSKTENFGSTLNTNLGQLQEEQRNKHQEFNK